MKKLIAGVLVGLMSLALYGCGGDACEDAADKLAECFDSTGDEGGGEEGECEGVAECTSECVNDASCEEIEASIAGETNSYTECVTACQG